MSQHELIIALINSGFSDVVMDAAREVGARGGTIVHARGTGNEAIGKKYGVVITPDKEMILILVNVNIRDAVLQAIYKAAGFGTDGAGIAFALPVDDVTGFGSSKKNQEAEQKLEEQEETKTE